MTRVIVDSDAGIDDALALLYLIRSPAAEIVAIGSVQGNVPTEVAARNLLRTLEIDGIEIPVALGAARPLAQPLTTIEGIHGQDGLGNTGQPAPARSVLEGESAAEQMVRLARSRPGELDLLTLGPLTNLALAIGLEPGLPSLLGRVVTMGGAFAVAGNVTTHAEWNVWADPEAAQLVLEAGFDQTWVGLDVTTQSFLEDHHLNRLHSSGDPAGQFAGAILDHIFKVVEDLHGARLCHLHDPLAAGVLLDPSLVACRELEVRVELRGTATRGMTVADLRGLRAAGDWPRTKVAMEVEGARFRDRFLAALAPDTGN